MPTVVEKLLRSKVTRLTGAAIAFQALAVMISIERSDRGVASPRAPVRPNFHLQSSEGSFVDSQMLRGRAYLLFFGFASCPVVCPATLMEMQSLLRAATMTSVTLPIYFVSIDSEKDPPDALKAFVSAFGDNVVGLTGSRGDIADAAKSVGVYFSDGADGIDHSALVYLVNAGGEVTDVVAAGEPRIQAMYKIRTLLASAKL